MTIRSRPAARLACAVFALAFALGGCFPMKPEPRPSEPPKPSLAPMSDEEAMAQVVEPTKEIVRAAGLQGITGGFSFESCNDQGEPPYRGVAEMGFSLPKDMEPKKYFAADREDDGWIAAGPTGRRRERCRSGR